MNAVVTGGSKGIGLAIVHNLAKLGYNIAILARNIQDLKACKEKLEIKFPDQIFKIFQVDLSNKEATIKCAVDIQNQFEKIDVLVNNAGVFIPGDLLEEPEGNLELMMETNLYSAYHLTRALLPKGMLPNKSGHIFNICSVASLKAYSGGGSYSVSKFALLGFSKGLREELKSVGIRVTSIMPGATWSNSWSGVDLPEDRLMQADDIASVVECALRMRNNAVVEDIVIRPQLGDL